MTEHTEKLFNTCLSHNIVALLFIPEVRSETRRYRSLIFIFPSSSSLIPFHCRLHLLSPLPSISLALVLHSPPTPTKYFFMQSSHLSLGLPLLLLPSTLSTSVLFVNRSPPILSMCPAHFNPFSSPAFS